MEAYIGQIEMFAGNFAPRNWMFCEGQVIAISENQALFSLLGDRYGGDGRATFGLPDMRGRIPVCQGQGIGLTQRMIGTRLGQELVALDSSHIPPHNHTFKAFNEAADAGSPTGAVVAISGSNPYVSNSALPNPDGFFDSTALSENDGGNTPHNNLGPYLAVRFIICLIGLYPPRN